MVSDLIDPHEPRSFPNKGPDTFSDINYRHQPIACPDSRQHTGGSLTVSHQRAVPCPPEPAVIKGVGDRPL
jgi:hypothetical protein